MRRVENPLTDIYGLLVGYTLFKAPQFWLLKRWFGVSNQLVPSHVASVSKIGEGFVEFVRRAQTIQPSIQLKCGEDHASTIRESGALVGVSEICPASNSLLNEFISTIENPANFAKSQPDGQQLAANLLEFAIICWQVEKIAINYSYQRLKFIVAQHGREFAIQEAKLTFPYSMAVKELIALSISKSASILATYDEFSPKFGSFTEDHTELMPISRDRAKSELTKLAKELGSVLGIDLSEADVAIDTLWPNVLGECKIDG